MGHVENNKSTMLRYLIRSLSLTVIAASLIIRVSGEATENSRSLEEMLTQGQSTFTPVKAMLMNEYVTETSTHIGKLTTEALVTNELQTNSASETQSFTVNRPISTLDVETNSDYFSTSTNTLTTESFTTKSSNNISNEISAKFQTLTDSSYISIYAGSGYHSAFVRDGDNLTVTLDESHPDDHGGRRNAGFLISVIDEVSGGHLSTPAHVRPWAVEGAVRGVLEGIQDGRLVVVATRDISTNSLSKASSQYFTSLGSVFAPLVGPGVLWFWAFIHGGPTLLEGLTPAPTQLIKNSSPQLMDIQIMRSNETIWCPSWPSERRWEARRELCSSYANYGDLCHCDTPYDTSQGEQRLPVALEKSVIVIIASRGPLLLRSLKTLASAKGFSKSRLVVFSDDSSSAELSLLLFALSLPLQAIKDDTEYVVTTISALYAFAIRYVKQTFDDVNSMIFLEDDVEVSHDFLIFLNSTAPLLWKDPSLYCVSAHNDLSYQHTSHDSTQLLRTESYTNYGWLARMDFLNDLQHLLDSKVVKFDWDMAAFKSLRRGRECVIPEVSRSFHSGSDGLHTTQYQYHLLGQWQHLNTDRDIIIPQQQLDRLEPRNYEEFIEELFSRAIFLDPTHDDFCSETFSMQTNVSHLPRIPGWARAMLPPNTSHEVILDEDKVLVLYFDLQPKHNERDPIFNIVSACFRIYCCDKREAHKGLHRIRLGKAHLLLVEYPVSVYSHLKPASVPVLLNSHAMLTKAERLRDSFLLRDSYHHLSTDTIWNKLHGRA